MINNAITMKIQQSLINMNQLHSIQIHEVEMAGNAKKKQTVCGNFKSLPWPVTCLEDKLLDGWTASLIKSVSQVTKQLFVIQ